MPSLLGRFSVDFTTNIAEFDFRYTQVFSTLIYHLQNFGKEVEGIAGDK